LLRSVLNIVFTFGVCQAASKEILVNAELCMGRLKEKNSVDPNHIAAASTNSKHWLRRDW
jgi:hypothetical protein